MKLPPIFKPKPTISEPELTSGLRWLTLEGTVSLGFNSITTSGFLAAYALALGANSLHIGVLAAAAAKTIETAKEIAEQIGVSEELAAAKAAEGALQAAEAIDAEAVARVKEAIPPAESEPQ